MRDEVDEGVAANERLTALASVLLLALLVVELATTPSVGVLLSQHVFVGVLLIGPLAVKLASTGYRFVHYYTGSVPYVRKGPPRLLLRILAPLLIATTLVLVGTGFALLVTGPDEPGPFVGLHNITFVIWLPIFAIHALAYIRRLPRLLAAELRGRPGDRIRGRALRLDLGAGALVFGAIVAVLALPIAAPWSSSAALMRQLPGPLVAGTLVAAVALLVVRPLRWV